MCDHPFNAGGARAKADASIIPDWIRVNTHVSTMAIGDRIADFIRQGASIDLISHPPQPCLPPHGVADIALGRGPSHDDPAGCVKVNPHHFAMGPGF